MSGVLDPKTGTYLFHCPAHGGTVHIKTATGLQLVRKAGRCQGCRAMDTYLHDPALVPVFEDWFSRAGVPESWR